MLACLTSIICMILLGCSLLPSTPLILSTTSMTLLNDSLSAYLTPLLEKHTAGQAIIYDDLIHSWQAAQAVLKTDFDPTVSKHLRELHESQLKAYQEAARKALTEEAQSISLPDVTDDMEDEAFVQRIISETEKPDWKVDETVWEEAWIAPLQERARAAFQQDSNGGDEEEEDEEMEDGEEEEGDQEKEVKSAVQKATLKKRTVASKAGKGLLKKKALGASIHKTTGASVGQRVTRGRARARRGGRGGAGAAK